MRLLGLLLFLIVLTSACSVEAVDYKVDYDFNKVKFDQIRSVSYFGEYEGPRSLIYFYTDDLSDSLDMLLKDNNTLVVMLGDYSKELGQIKEKITKSYFSKAGMLTFLFYKRNKKPDNNIVYRAMIIPAKAIRDRIDDAIGLSKYEIEKDKMFPVEFSEEEIKILNKTKVSESTFERFPVYDIKGNKGDISFKGYNTEWKIVKKSPYNISGYQFDTYLVKSEREKDKDISYYVVPGLGYLCDSYTAETINNVNQLTEAREIFIPELGFYWNSDLPGKYYVDYKEVNAKE